MGLSPAENKVYFGQLLGMCDQISFPLGMLTPHSRYHGLLRHIIM